MKYKKLIVILGPTGVGKTKTAIKIAKKLKTEIISCDSRQIYRELRIGTAVPTDNELAEVKHHFIQSKSIYEYYNASMFEFEALDLLDELFKKYKRVVMVGGSGLYINAVCYGIDDLPTIDPDLRKELAEKYKNEGIESIRKQLKFLDPKYYAIVDLKNHKRILKALEVSIMTGKPYSSFLLHQIKERSFNAIKIGLSMERDKLYKRIYERVDSMIASGLLKEAKQYYKDRNLNSLNTVGYKELFNHLDGKITLENAIELIKRNTKNYARKQLTWFRKDREIKWFNPGETNKIINFIKLKK
ncbi:MAG: tRNA (adenosine(37)-N6)-dimethylallyltransferase MiaA [Bacteroidales bacterium]|nr:MAG: tRNA (adenosine(37)-N6)-dimethylallyltransferase MiaA [Bacteroidales bacterium]